MDEDHSLAVAHRLYFQNPFSDFEDLQFTDFEVFSCENKLTHNVYSVGLILGWKVHKTARFVARNVYWTRSFF